MILEIELLHVGQIDDLEVEHRRAHARRLDEVLDRLREVEQHALVAAAFLTRHRHPLVGRGRRLAQNDGGVWRLEAGERGVDRLVGAARHGGISRGDVDAIRRGGFDGARDDQERRERLTEIRGAERKNRERRGGDDAGGHRVAAKRLPLDAATILDFLAALERRLEQPPHQRRRHLLRTAGTLRVQRGDDRRLERRLVFFEVERDLFVADLAQQWTDDEPAGGRENRDADNNAEGEDGVGTEAQRFEREGSGDQYQRCGAKKSRGAAQGQLHAPAGADLANDVNQG